MKRYERRESCAVVRLVRVKGENRKRARGDQEGK